MRGARLSHNRERKIDSGGLESEESTTEAWIEGHSRQRCQALRRDTEVLGTEIEIETRSTTESPRQLKCWARRS